MGSAIFTPTTQRRFTTGFMGLVKMKKLTTASTIQTATKIWFLDSVSTKLV